MLAFTVLFMVMPVIMTTTFTGLVFTMMMVVTSTAAFTIMMMLVAATAFSVVVMMFVIMATLTFAVMMMVVAAASASARLAFLVFAATTATTTAATTLMRTRKRHRYEGLIHHHTLQAYAFKHPGEIVVGDDSETVFGLRHANATSEEGVDSLLHQFHITRDVKHLVTGSFNQNEPTLFVNKYIAHFERTRGVAQSVFINSSVHRELSGNRNTIGVGKLHLLGSRQKRLRGTGFQRQKLRDLHF